MRVVGDSRNTSAADRDMRGISVCHHNFGWHVYMAGPCFDTYEEAIAYRVSLDAEGVTWRPQRDY